MYKISKTRKIIDALASPISFLLLGSVTIWLGFSVAKEAYRRHQAQVEIERLKAEIIALEQKKTNLSSLIDSLKDPEVIELEAKKRLNLKKPGEEVAVILREENDEAQNIVKKSADREAPAEQQEPNKKSEKFSNALKWWQYITGE